MRRSNHHPWLEWLEHTLGLREYSHLQLHARLMRIVLAFWLRPGSLQQTLAHARAPSAHKAQDRPPSLGTQKPKPHERAVLRTLLRAVFRIVSTALHDVLNPVLWLLNLTIRQPIRKLVRRMGQRLDLLARRAHLEKHLHRYSHTLATKAWLCWTVGLGTFTVFVLTAQTSLSLMGQWVFIAIAYCMAILLKRLPERFAHLCLMALTILLLARYVFWRFTSSLDLATGMELTLGYILLAAEAYTWVVLLFGFIQTVWPLKRRPMAMNVDINTWPSVDVYIPTYNEPLSVVRPTVYAAKGLDWPSDRITIYILDDGHRPAFAEFAKQAGVEYISRPDNSHAKAGNINHALQHTHGQYIAIFDCDHIPTRSFLQTTMAWFKHDPKCALVQTPHHFFSADPFERNFDVFRQMPNEGTLFYGLIQDGNDYWNAAFFCGSCAVIERQALQSVGGIATETVTEDAHTALKLHAKGYNSVYLNITQAAGLATETLADHIGQRIRWARGMAQIFRLDNPFLKKGLGWCQRVCYANAMLHFFYGIPRLIFLIMPLAYLFFEFHLINAAAVTILSYALPQLIIAAYTNSAIQGQYRRSFWSEVYETVLSWYIVLPTTLAFINPRLGKFNVTAKGGLIQRGFFDANIARPYLTLLLLNLLGFAIGLGRLFVFNTHESGTVTMNLLWCSFNLLILGTAVGVASEAPQQRQHHRVRMVIPAFIRLPGGYTRRCHTEEYSAMGLMLNLGDTTGIQNDSLIEVGLSRGDREFLFPARLSLIDNSLVEAQFTKLNAEQEALLIQCTFGRADAWLNWQENPQKDRALGGLKDVASKGLIGYMRLFAWVRKGMASAGQRLIGQRQRHEPWEH